MKTIIDHIRQTSALQRAVAASQRDCIAREEIRQYPDVCSLLGNTSRDLDLHAERLDALGDLLERDSDHLEEAPELDLTPPSAGCMPVLERWPASRRLRQEAVAMGGVATTLTLLHSLGLARSVETVTALTSTQLQDTARLLVDLNVALSALIVDESGRREPVAPAPDARRAASQHVARIWDSTRAGR